MADNPLTEATADSLNEVMNRDPLEYSRQDRDKIVEELRRMRTKWLAEEAAGKTRASSPKAAKAAAAKQVMSLGDLDIS